MRSHYYRIVVEGELGPRYASAFEGMTLSAHDGETEITGPIVDASHLQGLLERIASLGLTLRSVNPLETENAEPDAHTHAGVTRVDDTNAGAAGTVARLKSSWRGGWPLAALWLTLSAEALVTGSGVG